MLKCFILFEKIIFIEKQVAIGYFLTTSQAIWFEKKTLNFDTIV